MNQNHCISISQHRTLRNATLLCMLMILSLFNASSAYAKNISGEVTDSLTGEKVSLANIYLIKSQRGSTADLKGRFNFNAKESDSVRFSSLGYIPKTFAVSDLRTKGNKIRLSPSTTELTEFIVKPGKVKYSKKNNPAYDLMMLIRDNIKRTDPNSEPNYNYDIYERITLGLNDFELSPEIRNKRQGFLLDYADTAVNTNKPVLLMSVREKASTILHSSNPNRTKEVVTGRKSEGIDNSFNQSNIDKMLEDVLREVDIFGNDIPLMQNRFVSPLSHIAGDYYRYYITDTIAAADGKLIELSFAPKTPESFGFNGRMLVSKSDSITYVKKINMRVPRVINLNYVDNIIINQEFELDSLGHRHKTLDDMTVEIEIIKGTQQFYAHRVTTHSNFSYKEHHTLREYMDKLGNEFELAEAPNQSSDFWNDVRLVPMTRAEAMMGSMVGKMRQLPWFYWGEKALSILSNGWWRPTQKWPVEFGPVNTLISYNTAEGVRLRVGGMTNSNLSKHWFGRGYVAYGCRDRKWKYSGEVEYSIIPKKNHPREFPVNSIRLSHQYDIDMLGQHYLFTNADNVFLSWKRKESYLATYRRLTKLEYRLELNNNFSVAAGFQHQIQEATRWVPFIKEDGTPVKNFTLANFFIELRYAPGEKFVQGNTNRLPVNMDAPIFRLTHEFGPKRFLGSDFCLNRTEFSAQKRFWFSAFGYADVILKAGKIWSQVQFPELLWQNANLSYTIQPESYSLLNPMEFAFDYYGSLDLTYWMNGLILNRIPLIKKLKLREVITYKILMGGLTEKNNPEYNRNLFRFPGETKTSTLGNNPYMELGIGIDNILTILRVDYVWRLTYRNYDGVDRSGLRISLHFSF